MTWTGISGSYCSSILIFLRKLYSVFHNGWINLHSHQFYTIKCFLFSTFLPIFVIFILFEDCHSWQVWDDISSWFWFAFLWWLAVLSLFSCACWPSVCLLWENIYSGFCSFLNWVCFCFYMSCLYILDINLLLIVSFANVFSHSIGCLSFCQWFPLLDKSF